MDGSDKSRFHEDPNGLLVRVAPLDGATQVYVPTHMRDGVMMPEHYPPQAGHSGANEMYVALRVPAHAPWLARRSLVHRVTRMTCHAPVRTGGAVGAGWDLD